MVQNKAIHETTRNNTNQKNPSLISSLRRCDMFIVRTVGIARAPEECHVSREKGSATNQIPP